MPRMLTYGCEIEMFEAPDEDEEDSDYSEEVMIALSTYGQDGLCVHDELCSYHCSCDLCVYDRNHALLAAQHDSTVGAEFITRILSTCNNHDTEEMRQLKGAFGEVLDRTGWRPDGEVNAGNHIHVGWPRDYPYADRAKVMSMFNGLFHAERFLWESSIATGGAPRVRGYNAAPSVYYEDWSGSWLGANPGTVEFRLWNTPRDPERLLVHPALSVAMMAWGLDTLAEEGDIVAFNNASTTSDWAANRARPARKRIAKIVREIWPDRFSANLAAELIAA